MTVSVFVLAGLGLNSDVETQWAFELAGADRVERVHIGELLEHPDRLLEYDIAAFPGGFAHGDHVRAARVLAVQLRHQARDAIRWFVDDGRPVIGICNGFQVLLQLGLFVPDDAPDAGASLSYNDSGIFEDRWVELRGDAGSPCLWTRGIERMALPVRHGEGKLVFSDSSPAEAWQASHCLPLAYARPEGEPGEGVPYPFNPNGSEGHAAAMCNARGNVYGMMPHPEACISRTNHPRWTRPGQAPETPEGLAIFQNAVRCVRG